MLSIVYGLFAAIGWGTADFAGGLASRRVGAFPAVIFTELAGLAVLLPAALGWNEPRIEARNFLLCAAAGGAGMLALSALFQAFKEGQMSLAAPVSAVTAAVLPIGAGYITEGALEPVKLAGCGLALLAIWLISYNPVAGEEITRRLGALKLPLLAGIGFGLYFILFNLGSQEGILWPLVASRTGGTVVVGGLVLLQGGRLLPKSGAWMLLILNVVLDLISNLMYLLAGQAGRMDIAAVLTSLYPGMTILLAWLVLKERAGGWQRVGIVLALAAILLIVI